MLNFKSLRRNLWEDQHEDASQETCHFHHLIRLSGKKSSRFMRKADCILFYFNFQGKLFHFQKGLDPILSTASYSLYFIGISRFSTNLLNYNGIVSFMKKEVLL